MEFFLSIEFSAYSCRDSWLLNGVAIYWGKGDPNYELVN